MIDQESRERAETKTEGEPPLKRRAYATPAVIDLGDVRELTRGGTHSQQEAHGPFP